MSNFLKNTFGFGIAFPFLNEISKTSSNANVSEKNFTTSSTEKPQVFNNVKAEVYAVTCV